MKKDILFIMNNLTCGGAEKALISLLETIDFTKYNVDLLLFKKEGLFLSKVPPKVNLLEEPFGYKYFDMSIKSALLECIKNGRLDVAFSRIMAGFIFRTETNQAKCEQRVWKYLSLSMKKLNKEYDIAIGFLEKTPIYFSVEKVTAKKKIGFIHNDYNKLGMDSAIDYPFFEKLDHVITVSDECASVLKEKFPKYKHKIEMIYNIVSPRILKKLSLESTDLNANEINIVSVGRLHSQKGFDLAIKACKEIVERGHNIKWHVIGEGEERSELAKLISSNQLEDHFFLKGIRENPYPYIYTADIYVQPSRFEGKSIAIDEAKILNKPIVVTNFSTAEDQIRNKVNGLIVDMTPQGVAEGIINILSDRDLKDHLISNLRQEQLGTEVEVEKLYKLFKVS